MQREKLSTYGPRADWMVCLALAVVTLGLYWPARHFEFNNYDDAQYITQNYHVQQGLTWNNLEWAFTTGYASNWHPLTWLSHLLDWQLFGANAGGHHLMGVLFHVADTVLLFLALRQLTGAFWPCAWVAALFGWHPLHVESVAWVAERKDVLSAFFAMLTLIAYARYVRLQSSAAEPATMANPRSRVKFHYGLALLFFALGLMSKPMLVSLPLVLLLLDFWPLKRVANEQTDESSAIRKSSLSWLIVEKAPFFALALASCVVTFLVQKHGSAVQSLEAAPLRERLSNAAVAYVRYLAKLLWPVKLSLIYPYSHHLPVMEVAGAAVLLALICGMVWILRKSHPWLIVGWAWFVLMLVPVIGLVQVGAQAMADRYSYLPSIGLFLAAAWECARIRLPSLRIAAAAIGLVTLLACLAITPRQIGYWRNSITLFSHAVDATKDNAIAECNLSAALMDAGRKDEALVHLKEALRIDPNYPEALNDMGIFQADAGNPAEAENYFRQVLQQQPDYAPALFQLGTVLTQEGHLDEAVDCYRHAIRINPALDRAHANLGIILSREGKVDEAAQEFIAALAYEPNSAYAHNGLGLILESRGRMADAEQHYAAAVRAKPDFAEAQDNLGVALAARGDFAEAAHHFEAALKLQPQSAEIHFNYGNSQAAAGKLDEAIVQFSEAARIQTNYLEAHFNLAHALAQKGQFSEAVEAEKKALVEAISAGKTNVVAEAEKRLQMYEERRLK